MVHGDRATFFSVEPSSETFAESLEESGTFPSPGRAQTLSRAFWGFDLYQGLPRVLSRDGIEAVAGNLDRIREFLIREFPSLTEEGLGMPLSAAQTDAKRWYLGSACDAIELRYHDQTIGAILGAPEDWTSYYVRILAVAPAFQRPALTRRFARECLLDPLALHCVQRVVAETSPANVAMSRGLCELHFHVTGHQLSDRYGPLVRYTKFLDPASEAAFLSRYAGTAPPRLISRNTPKGGHLMKKKFALATA